MTEQSARELAARGHEVTVLARHLTGAPLLPVLEQGSQQDGLDVRWIKGSTGADTLGARLERLERIFERVLLELLPDVVVIAHLMGHSPNYVPIAHRWGIPVMVELHDFYMACERAHLERAGGALCDGPERGRACAQHCFAGEDGALGRWRARTARFAEALAQADGAITPSELVAGFFRGVREVRVIPNGIVEHDAVPAAPSSPDDADRPLELALLGAVVPHKGPHVVVEALRKAKLPAVRCTLFGPVQHPYADELRDQADDIDGCRLSMFGPYEQRMVPFLLRDVDAVIVPSIVWETFSIVVREAMSCGVPVIAARHGALAEAIRENVNGLLYQPFDSSGLAAILRRLDDDRGELARLRAGIERTDWITLEQRAGLIERMLGELVGTVPPQPWTATALIGA